MIICICNNVTEKEIKEACKKECSVEQVQKCTKAGTQCGTCMIEVAEIIKELKK